MPTVDYGNGVFTFIKTANGESSSAQWLRAKIIADGAVALGTISGSTYTPIDFNAKTPVTVVSGVVTAIGSAGSTTQPIYIDSNNQIQPISATVGGNDSPIWLNNGIFTTCTPSGGKGDSSHPIYLNSSGKFMVCTNMIPVITYSSGVLTIQIN